MVVEEVVEWSGRGWVGESGVAIGGLHLAVMAGL